MAATAQHYVPRFVLNRFATGKKNKQIFTFDKHTGRVFRTNIRNVAVERSFYDLDLGKAKATLEPSLSKVETVSAAILDRLIASETIPRLSHRDRAQLALFYAIQFVRGHYPRSLLRSLRDDLSKAAVNFRRNDRRTDGR